MEIAKLRAARWLWAKITEAYKPSCSCGKRMTIHSVTLNWNKTAYDPYVNMLRTTTEAMSAILGGSDTLTVQAFDASYRKPDEFSERIARNQQNLLREETNFDKVVDPAAGSYYIESLTASIAEKAYQLFLEIEENGGYIKALKAGFIQKIVEETAQKRDMNLATRREILLGVNQYPNLTEQIGEQVKENIFTTRTPKQADKGVRTIVPYRGAEAFEELRLTIEKSGRVPKVFLLTYGNLAMRKARAMFSTNFFGCAGFQIIDNPGFSTIESGVEAALQQGANIVVLCSSDDEYATIAQPAFTMLKDKAIVVLAGYPTALVDTFKEFGLKHFIHVKSNVLESLKMFVKELKLA